MAASPRLTHNGCFYILQVLGRAEDPRETGIPPPPTSSHFVLSVAAHVKPMVPCWRICLEKSPCAL